MLFCVQNETQTVMNFNGVILWRRMKVASKEARGRGTLGQLHRFSAS